MARLIPVDDPADPRLADYTRLRDVNLRKSLEAEHGLFMAEGEKVIRRAVATGYPVRSLLTARRWVGPLADVLGDAPVYVVDDAVAAAVTGFPVHRGALASMERLPLPSVAEVLAGAPPAGRRVRAVTPAGGAADAGATAGVGDGTGNADGASAATAGTGPQTGRGAAGSPGRGRAPADGAPGSTGAGRVPAAAGTPGADAGSAGTARDERAAARRLVPPRRVLVLEDLVDHGNVGAIFRCAAALGVDAVILSPRCADPLYRRSVKVSMGAVFAIPYARMGDWREGLGELRAAGFTLLALTPGPAALPIGKAPIGERTALLLGTEGDGLSSRWLGEADHAVRIPMNPGALALGVDSLNVVAAAAIACHELTRD